MWKIAGVTSFLGWNLFNSPFYMQKIETTANFRLKWSKIRCHLVQFMKSFAKAPPITSPAGCRQGMKVSSLQLSRIFHLYGDTRCSCGLFPHS
jgi:hypothetical protein